MNISKREKILVAVILVLGMVFMFNKYFYAPVNNQIDRLESENAQLNEEMSEFNREKKQQLSQAEQKQKAMDELQNLKIMIPKDKQLEQLVRFLQSAAEVSAIQLISIDFKENVQPTGQPAGQPPGQPGQVPAVKVLNLGISTYGNYFQLRNFLLQLESCPRIITVQSCILAAQTKGGTTGVTTSSGQRSSSSSEPPPSAPLPKGVRISDKDKTQPNDVAAIAAKASGQKASDRYDANKMQMDLQISTYYR